MADTRPFGERGEARSKTIASGSVPGRSKPAPLPEGSLAGQHLKHFRVDRLLAEGGMGEVYLGVDVSLSRPVAIKVVRAELAADPRYLQVFLREAQAQANVVHSHVLQAYYVGEERGIWFLAMQLAEGGTLDDGLIRGERLGWKEAAQHMTHIVEGMAEAARLGIVHRDIKPANILLDRFGEAHLADFGLATSTGMLASVLGEKPLGPGTRRPGTTYPGTVMGTPEYMPPEQLQGKPVDERADIYAIGATFYQLLSGQLPYAIADIPSAQAALRGPPAPALGSLRGEIPRAFAGLIDRCLSRDPAKRPASHGELLALLRKVGPRPEVVPSPVVRALSFLLDLFPFAVVLPFTYQRLPGLAFAVLSAWLLLGLQSLSATPGQWLMRVWIRSRDGGDVALWKLFLRSMLQLGWLLPLSGFLALAYADSRWGTPLGLLAVAWAAVALLGGLGSLRRSGQALHDRLTGTRVLIATG